MRGRGEGKRQVGLNRPTQYTAQTEQGLASTASTMTIMALTNDFAVGTQDRLVKTNQIRVEPRLSSHVCRRPCGINRIDYRKDWRRLVAKADLTELVHFS
jgi:hypothetical protein